MYRNLRFRLPDVPGPPAGRLTAVHWSPRDGICQTVQRSRRSLLAPQTGSDEAQVDLTLSVAPPATAAADAALYPWHTLSRYTFIRQLRPILLTRISHLTGILDTDNLELLPDAHSPQYQPMKIFQYLTGDDLLHVRSFVSPIRQYDSDGNIIGWDVYPEELGYILGPVAIAPPWWVTKSDGTPDTGNPKNPMRVDVQALVYAQNGSWSILPGPWFSEDINNVNPDSTKPDPANYPRYHEPLNIQLQFLGAISENMPAPIGDVADWTSKWSGTKQYAETYGSSVAPVLLRSAAARRVGVARIR